MRVARVQCVIAAGFLAVAGCSSSPSDEPGGAPQAKVDEITEQQVCDLLPPEQVGKAFGITVDEAVPDRLDDQILGRSVLLTCQYMNAEPAEERGYVSTSVKYHYYRGPLQEYVDLSVSDDVVSEPVPGLADQAFFFPEGWDPDSPGMRSDLHAFDQLDGAIRTVEVSVYRGGERSELEPVLKDLLAALDD